MRWKAVILMLMLTLAVLAGCKQQCFMTIDDVQHYQQLGLPARPESEVSATVVPRGADMPPPPTVYYPERKPRPLSLAEAIALALEHGRVGSPQLNGATTDDLATLQGRAVVTPDNPIRVLALEPAIAATDMETSLSKFDARWTSSMIWQQTDQPVGGNVLQDLQNGQGATLNSSILKPLPTGGVAGITFTTQYLDLFNPPTGITNPQYRPRLQFQFEQPLLQGFGVEINQIRAQHPGSLLSAFNTNTGVDGIVITRVQFDESRAEFERQVHVLLANVEIAYWNLYGAYYALYSRDEVLNLAFTTFSQVRRDFETRHASSVDLAQARAQYETFRGQRYEALAGVLNAEHQLRDLLGLPMEDGKRLVPIDTPTMAPFQPDWYTSLATALATRPELVLARADLKQRQFAVLNQKNLLLPDVRFLSTYDINGLGTELAGGGSSNPNSAFSNLARNQFHDWQVGLQAQWVFGNRAAYAGLRAARLRLAQGFLQLKDQEDHAEAALAQQYQLLASTYYGIETQRAQRVAYGQELLGRLRAFAAHLEEATAPTALSFLLDTQRFYSDALRTESAAIVEYNNTLVRFEFARGTIMQRDNVYVSEGPLPRCAQIRAVEHARQREDAIILHERQVFHYDPTMAGPHFGLIEDGAGGPLPRFGLLLNAKDDGATALPAPPLFQGQPPPADAVPPASAPLEPTPGTLPPPRKLPDLPDLPASPTPAPAASLPPPTIGMILGTHDAGAHVGMIIDTPVAAKPTPVKGQAGMILDTPTDSIAPAQPAPHYGMILK